MINDENGLRLEYDKSGSKDVKTEERMEKSMEKKPMENNKNGIGNDKMGMETDKAEGAQHKVGAARKLVGKDAKPTQSISPGKSLDSRDTKSPTDIWRVSSVSAQIV